MPPVRRILHADADAMFVAAARWADPEGAGRAPLLIVGGSASSRGVVTSASYEARQFGVRAGMPMARAVRLCPQALVVPVPRDVVGAKSREIRMVLARFAPVVQQTSVDEAYLDLTGTEALYGGEPLADTAHRIRRAVLDETGFAVSIGGATNRLVAKLCVERAKPKPGSGGTGVYVVPPGGEGAFMAELALRDIGGVGPATQQLLAGRGLTTVREVLALDRDALVRLCGPRLAGWLHDVARGIDDSPVEPPGPPKSVSREDTFPADLHDDAALGRELVRLVDRVAADLRGDGLVARTVSVTVKDADFKRRGKSRTLPAPVCTTAAVLPVARELLAELRRARRVGVRLLGVGLSSLDPPSGEQLSLFGGAGAAPVESPRDRAVAAAVDAVRAKFGPKAVRPGAVD